MHLGVGDRDFHADMRTRQGPAGHFRVRAVLLPGLCHADGCLLRRRPRLPGALLIQKLQPPVTAASSTAVEPAAGGASGVGAIR